VKECAQPYLHSGHIFQFQFSTFFYAAGLFAKHKNIMLHGALGLARYWTFGVAERL
jgi:hypothetical protein